MAPAPYHQGPEIPYWYATALDWSCARNAVSSVSSEKLSDKPVLRPMSRQIRYQMQ